MGFVARILGRGPSFRGRRVLVTGASSGIGAALCEALAREGARVVLVARRTQLLEENAARCRALGAEAFVVTADVAREEDCRRLVQQSVAHLGGLDVVVLNAGVSMWALFEEITDLALFRTLMDTNFHSAVAITHEALPHLRSSQGQLVVISSLIGKTGVPTRTAYAASKHALHGFFDSLRVELEGSGVSVTIVCPGFVQTDARRASLGADGQPIGDSPLGDEAGLMSASTCARAVLEATRARRRELVMTPLPRLVAVVRALWPGLIDAMTRRRMSRAVTGARAALPSAPSPKG